MPGVGRVQCELGTWALGSPHLLRTGGPVRWQKGGWRTGALGPGGDISRGMERQDTPKEKGLLTRPSHCDCNILQKGSFWQLAAELLNLLFSGPSEIVGRG